MHLLLSSIALVTSDVNGVVLIGVGLVYTAKTWCWCEASWTPWCNRCTMVKWQILYNRIPVGHNWRRGPYRRFRLFSRQFYRVFLLFFPIKTSNIITMDSIPTSLLSRSTPSVILLSISFQYSEGPDKFNSNYIKYVKRSKLATKYRNSRLYIWKYSQAYIRSNNKKEIYYYYKYAAVSYK